MLTKNAWKYISNAITLGGVSSQVSNVAGESFSMAPSAITSLFRYIGYARSGANYTTNTTALKGYGTYIGSVANTPSLDDIAVADPSELLKVKIVENNVAIEQFEKYAEISSTLTITNEQSVDITARELYYFFGESSGAMAALMDHTVLDEPVVIPAYSTRRLTYTIRIDF